MLSGLLWLCPAKGTHHLPRGQLPSPPQGQGCAVSALRSPTHFHPAQPLILSHLAPALPLLVFPRVWELSCGWSQGARAGGVCVGVCTGAELGSVPSSPGAGRSFPFIPVAALPSFRDACFLGAVVLGRLVWGCQWILGGGIVLRVVAVGVQPHALGCWGGQWGWCLLGRRVKRCPPGMLGLRCFVLGSGKGLPVPLSTPVPWHHPAVGETEAWRAGQDLLEWDCIPRGGASYRSLGGGQRESPSPPTPPC